MIRLLDKISPPKAVFRPEDEPSTKNGRKNGQSGAGPYVACLFAYPLLIGFTSLVHMLSAYGEYGIYWLFIFVLHYPLLLLASLCFATLTTIAARHLTMPWFVPTATLIGAIAAWSATAMFAGSITIPVALIMAGHGACAGLVIAFFIALVQETPRPGRACRPQQL
jgi:hypothetical protein